jgi:four helix bundle protein
VLVKRFEDLKAWQAARRLTADVHSLARSGRLRPDRSLADQMRRAVLSTMNNVAEGFDSASRSEFCRFLRYSARSASEVQSSLYVALDQALIDEPTFDRIYAEAQLVRQLCSGLIRHLRPVAKPSRKGPPHVAESPAPYGLTGSRADWLTLS